MFSASSPSLQPCPIWGQCGGWEWNVRAEGPDRGASGSVLWGMGSLGVGAMEEGEVRKWGPGVVST